MIFRNILIIILKLMKILACNRFASFNTFTERWTCNNLRPFAYHVPVNLQNINDIVLPVITSMRGMYIIRKRFQIYFNING